MNQTTKKLALRTQTIRTLELDQLDEVGGAAVRLTVGIVCMSLGQLCRPTAKC